MYLTHHARVLLIEILRLRKPCNATGWCLTRTGMTPQHTTCTVSTAAKLQMYALGQPPPPPAPLFSFKGQLLPNSDPPQQVSPTGGATDQQQQSPPGLLQTPLLQTPVLPV